MSEGCYTVGSACAARGQVATGELAVATAMDGREVTIPVCVIHGAVPGPTLLVEGGLHGIEIIAVDLCRRLLGAVDPAVLAGTLVLAPQVNPWAFHASTRATPHDQLDMNRVFPGTNGSTLSHVVARRIVAALLDRADFVIDCHSCNPPSLHFTLVGTDGNPAVDAAALGMARAFGYPVVRAGGAYGGTLRGYCTGRGIPAITPEFVFSRRFDDVSAGTGTTGILNVMKHLGLLPGGLEPVGVPGAFSEVMGYRILSATKGGFCYFEHDCGDRVAAGDTVAVLRDVWGRETERVVAPQDGLVLAFPIQGNQAAASGDKVAYLAY